MPNDSIVIIQKKLLINAVNKNYLFTIKMVSPNITVAQKAAVNFVVSKAGVQGMQGERGINGDEIFYTAAEGINSYTPVCLVGNVLYKMDNANLLHQFSFVGFTSTSVLAGGQVLVKKGVIVLTGWNLTPNKNYLAGPNGTIILENNTVNSFTKVVGFSQDANTLLIITQNTAVIKT